VRHYPKLNRALSRSVGKSLQADVPGWVITIARDGAPLIVRQSVQLQRPSIFMARILLVAQSSPFSE
jgi:hypothetical protein